MWRYSFSLTLMTGSVWLLYAILHQTRTVLVLVP
jgi:hypothetical protein